MAEPRRRGRAGAEPEEIARLQQQAIDAANAFRNYIVGGDPARRQAFWTIYNSPFGGATLHDNSTFMTKLFEELDRIGQDSQVRPVLDAFTASRGRLFGFLWSNPVHFTDFIDTVYNLRTLLGRAPTPDQVRRLVTQAQSSEGRPARADSQVGRIRAAIQAQPGLSVEDAVRADFERANREEALQRYDQGLVDIVWGSMPRQLATRAAGALRDFILTGDDSKRTLFRSIWDANTSQAFTDAFTTEFRTRIFRDSASGLAAIAQAYDARHSGTDPNEFANMITRLYQAASRGTAQDVEALRQAEGTNVIDPLLRIVAQGMAGRAITLLRDVLETGNQASRDAFVGILNGRLAIVANNAVQMPTVENNDVFWTEFTRMYTAEISQNSRLATLVRSFQRNILPIAIRDIYTELARASPDTARLNSDYGPDLVNLVAGSLGSLTWMLRPDADLNAEITRRARAEDPAAVRINGMRVTFNKATGLREVYAALVSERARARGLEAPDVMTLLERNFDALSYLAGAPADVQRELDRRARLRPPDALATQLKARFPTNAGEALSRAYGALRDARQRRAQLVQTYGQDFVDAVSANLDNLQWVLRPVEEIDSEMRTRRDDAFVRSVNSAVGYSVGTLAHALRDVYTELGRSSPDRARLEQRYGANLVQFVETNRARLAWLGGDLATVERTLQDPSTDAVIREAQGRLYSYTPVQLVSAIARARSAISRRGLALADATDAYGTVFVGPVVSRQAVSTPSISPTAAQPLQAVLESRCQSIIRDFETIDSQLRWNVLEPARILIRERIRLWRQENDAIRLEARQTQDPTALAALERRQQVLIGSMLTPADMRRAVEMAFSMIHLAETGGDMSRAPSLEGVSTTDMDIGTLRRLTEWYNGLGTGGKQPVIGDVVSAVLYRADPNLYRFITGVEEPGLASAISRTYALTQRRGGDTRQTLVSLYGEPFVALVESQAGNLRMMESPAVMQSPTATMQALRMAENELYASVVVRVYRAIANPRQGEDRATMVTLFGEEFVRTVESQREQLTTLGTGTAGLEQIRALPQPVKQALFAAYPAAYAQSVGRLARTFRSQDEYVFRSMSAVYSVLRERPQRSAPADQRTAFDQRVQELYVAYGEQFVRAVDANMAQLDFLQSPTSSARDLSRLSPEVRERLNVTFESGPAVGRATFMTNFMRVTTQLPRVYTQLRSALAFSNPTDTLPTTFGNAIQYYRDQFGTNDYLFNQFINIDLLSRNIQRLARQYNITLPAYIMDGIDTPEELSRFLSSDVGRDFLVEGRRQYDRVEQQYLQQRQDQNFHPTTGEYTDANVTNLRNQLSILDALYLGMALPDISSTGSAFSRAAATATFNAILVISNRDPYLVGPFLLQVLPAIIAVAQDERTIVAAIESFNNIFTQRYESGTREIAYSTALNRRYFLEVFARIGAQLPEVTSTFDHNRLEDELRLVPEPRTDEGYMSPLLYRYRQGFWQGDGLEPLPTMYGQQGSPIRLLPTPFMPTSPYLPVPGGFRIDSGASGLFSSMYDQLRPPAERMFRQRVPQRFRIGALGASTIIRRINQLFGPMPVDYNDYWLSGFGETGGFYAHEERGPTSRDRGGAAAVGGGRTISGGTRGTARWTRDQTEVAPPVAEGQPSQASSTTTDTVDVSATSVRLPMPMSGPVPLPLFGLIPYNMFGMPDGTGIHRARQEFHYENAASEQRVTTPGVGGQPGTTTVTDQQTSGRTRGLLDTYSRISRESQTDMLLFVSGEHVPELTGPGGATTQEGQDRLKTRLYFVTKTGDIYQLAYGLDTRAQLLNYLYAGANTQQVLASARAVGRQMLTGDSAAAGFDGAAVGFTLPRSGGDSFSSLALGQLVRSMSTMDPVHAEQAVGMAVTSLLSDRRQRDVYAAFYRGAEMVTMDPQDRTHISNSRFAEGTGELMWRRIRIDPMAYQAELRAVGGMPLTVGARGRLEWRPSRYQTNAVGLTAAYSGIDLLRETRAAGVDSDQIYGRMNTILTSLYGWSEDEARDTGWLAAGSYLYARMEDWTVRNPDGSYTTTRAGPEGTPESHYASAMFMYWAQRHGILMGAQRVPGWTRIYDRIDQAMRQIQQNPANEAQILTALSTALRQDLKQDIWRFALAYGYDGERVRVYTVAGGQYVNDETAYGNLYALALFGRPTAAFVDILGHAYGYSPLVISEDPASAGGFSVRRDRYSPFLDLYGGFGIVDWPSVSLQRYQRDITITGSADIPGALRDAYREMGGTRNRTRLIRLYGEGLVGVVEEGRASLDWMIRPAAQVRTEMQTRLSQDDPIVMSFLNLRRGRTSGRQEASAEDAAALIDIYREVRRAAPDRQRLETQYSRELVDLVERNSTDLDWVLLPPDRMRTELTRRAQTSGSIEARISESQIPAPPAQADLTGPEVKRLMEQNMLDVLVGATGAESRVGLSAERYDVLLGSHLGSPEGRRARGRNFYILHTPVAERAEARGSLVIGDDTDLDEWMRHGHEIGRGISRLEVAQSGSDYTFTFSGDRRLRALTAERLVGGISIPIRPADYGNFRVGSSWTVGGLVQVLQDHRLDLLAGALYGRREFGNERWDQWTITMSGRLQGTNTATVSEQWYGYVFFNQANKKIVFASDGVFSDSAEMRSVCESLGGAGCTNLTELSRTTGGVGLEWARTDVITGDRMSFHFFFEGGAESYQRFGGAGTTGADGTYALNPNRDNAFVFRSGAAFSYTQQSPNSTIPNIYSLSLTGQSGTWPLMPGDITRPEYLQSYESAVGAGLPGWSLMLHGRLQW